MRIMVMQIQDGRRILGATMGLTITATTLLITLTITGLITGEGITADGGMGFTTSIIITGMGMNVALPEGLLTTTAGRAVLGARTVLSVEEAMAELLAAVVNSVAEVGVAAVIPAGTTEF